MSKTATAAKASNIVNIASAALARVAPAALAQGKSRAETADIVKAAIGKNDKGRTARQAACRLEYMAGRMAYTLNVDVPAARKLLGYANAKGTGKLKAGQGRRNAVQEKAYNAAKVYWSDILRAAGLVADSPKAGNTNAKGKADKRAPHHKDKGVTTEKAAPAMLTAAQLPKAKTREDVEAFVLQTAVNLFRYLNKNASVASPQCSTLVEDFHRATLAAIGPARGNKG